MKMILFALMVLGSILIISSCDSDDSGSNDIDIITPNDDTTETSIFYVPLPRKA